MYFRVIRMLADHLNDKEQTAKFMELVEIRQRLFRTHKCTLLILDQYDLICDHILIHAKEQGQLIGYIRSIPISRCREYGMPFPIESLILPHSEYRTAYARFLGESRDPVHMGYLCFDPVFKKKLRGVKAIDLMVWIGLQVAGIPRGQLGFAATLNNRYRQDEIMRLLGDWLPDLPDLQHPLIDDLHRVVLIPKIADDYWQLQNAKFLATYGALGDQEGRDLLRGIKIAA
jgi:hypothetical protein